MIGVIGVGLLMLGAPNPYLEPVPIGGTWSFRADGEAEWAELQVPGTWVGTAYEDYAGWAEYETRVALPDERPGPLTLLLSAPYGAAEVFVNDQLIAKYGSPPPGYTSPFLNLYLHDLAPVQLTSPNLTLRMRVYRPPHRNRFYSGFGRAGLSAPNFYVGPRVDLERQRDQILLARYTHPTYLWCFILAVLFATFGFIHLVFFLGNRRDTPALWFGLFALLLAVGGPAAPLPVRVGSEHSELIVRLSGLVTDVGDLCFLAFLYTLFRIGRRFALSVGGLKLLVLGAHLLPVESVLRAAVAPLSLASALSVLVYLVFALGTAWKRRRPEAGLLLVGFTAAATLAVFAAVSWFALQTSTAGSAPFLGASALTLFGTVTLSLSRRSARQIRELGQAYDASRRFVPAAFLRRLGRDEVVDVTRGDVAAETMTVMFADIRGFTARAQHQTPSETLAFLNRYLGVIEPHIESHGGFVNQYYGDGIMALFETAGEAVAAAELMVRDVAAEFEGLEIGVGLHSGPLVLGTIGGGARLDTAVVGDTVNVAARVESLTKEYGQSILLTRETLAELPDSSKLRRVAETEVRNRTLPVELFTTS